MKSYKIIWLSFCFLSIVSTCIVAATFIKRIGLSYNDEGRYFDEVNAVVYHQQAIVIYGLLLFGLLAVTAGVIFLAVKAKTGGKSNFRN